MKNRDALPIELKAELRAKVVKNIVSQF